MKSLNELNRIEPELLQAIKSQVDGTLESGWFVLGAKVEEFEVGFAKYIGASHCISVANGTDALEIALRSLGIGRSQRVATVANAGFYATTAILSCGAIPCYVDVDAQNLTMSVEALATVLSSQKLDAVIITHLYGKLAQVQEVQNLCEKHGVPLIEDCAQAHGASLQGQKAGSFGDLACFSFYPTKNLGAMGDGGAVCTSRAELAARVRALRQYGWSHKYHVVVSGGRNSRLDELQAGILSLKLSYLDHWNQKRRSVAQRYNTGIENPRVCGKPRFDGSDYVAHLYVLQVDDRTDLMRHLKQLSIPHDIHYPVPDYRQESMRNLSGGYDLSPLKNTEESTKKIITLPCFPAMSDQEVSSVVTAINAWGN